MTDDLEDDLRKALRPVDPGEEFTARVLARAASQVTPELHAGTRPSRAVRRRLPWVPVALAASFAAAVIIGHEWRERREQEGLAARKELIEALRVTSRKLDLAYRIVNSPAPSRAGENPGA
ncbi:MAG: hypothetical protein ACREVV_05460 [Steroidobacteraceae bacterium]